MERSWHRIAWLGMAWPWFRMLVPSAWHWHSLREKANIDSGPELDSTLQLLRDKIPFLGLYMLGRSLWRIPHGQTETS
jgi:hypothetical protein